MSDQQAWWLNTHTHDFERESEASNSQGECLYSTHVSGATSSVHHRVYLWEDPTDCHISPKHLRFSNQMISSRKSWFPDKAMSTHIEFCKFGVDYLRRLFKLISAWKRWVLVNALNYCPVSCDVHLTSGTLIRSLRRLYDRLIVYAIGQS